mmetsp:Transcript_4941/g.12458  ORF Transcript_4941/g.12458 Transcript_4941/m.12458 type:complete len:206 (+) Transcript_4941:604-1221(+)
MASSSSPTATRSSATSALATPRRPMRMASCSGVRLPGPSSPGWGPLAFLAPHCALSWVQHALWTAFQCCFWCSLQQYATARHAAHLLSFSPPSGAWDPHIPHSRSLLAAAVTLMPRLGSIRADLSSASAVLGFPLATRTPRGDTPSALGLLGSVSGCSSSWAASAADKESSRTVAATRKSGVALWVRQPAQSGCTRPGTRGISSL